MSYLVNQTRVSSLIVGGVDYTSAMVSWTASDQSAYKNGCVQTTGTLVLGTFAGGPLIEDYDRNNFKRGVVVTLDLQEPGGSTYRHPRGLLYIVASSYNVEAESLILDLGCRLTMMALTEKIDDLVALVPVQLDVAQTTFSNCSAAFASAGQYIYQDNQGDLQSGELFQGDGYGGVAAGEWTSVLGYTSTSVQPLAGTGAIPDEIALSYQVPSDGLNDDNRGKVDEVVTDSYYFIRYPAVVYVRTNSDATGSNPNGTLDNVTNVFTGASAGPTGSASSCGNTPDAPDGVDQRSPSCSEGYQLENEPVFIPAFRRDKTTTSYDGPGAQVSTVYKEVRGPALEANSQYYADKFAYCRSTWSTACNPNGSCPFEGTEEILLGYTESINYYGEANELVRTVVDSYSPILSAAQPSDWRSGIVGGVPQDFNQSISTSEMYRASRTDTTYYREGASNVQKVDTYNSTATRGVGIGGSLDALDGIKTTVIRKSTTTTTLNVAPDIANSSTTDTKDEISTLILSTTRYQKPPEETGPYVLEEQVPVPLLFATQSEIDAALEAYENYIVRLVKGDTYGLQIAEGMRSEVTTSWRPGMPFRYADNSKDKVLALRMDATVWGVGQEESGFVTNGLWVGFSDGSVVLPINTVGDSLPDMGGGVTPPTAPIPPSIENETSIDSGSFMWNIDVFIGLKIDSPTYGADGLLPVGEGEQTCSANFTTTCYVAAFIVEPGDVLATLPDGSIPLELGGSLIVADANVVQADLFS